MADLNKVLMVARLTKDIEVKYTPNGKAIGEFSIAVNSRIKKNEQMVDEVSYFDCNLFGAIATSLQSYLQKGKQISLVGELKQQRWVSKEGQNRSKVVINVEEIQLLGGGNKNESNNKHENNYQPDTRNNYQVNNYQPGTQMHFSEDIPF